MKKILILGAGLVARPIIRDLLNKGYALTVTSLEESEAKTLTGNHPNAKTMSWTVDQTDLLDQLVADHDLTVSLIPWLHHPVVAKSCVKNKKNMVTTSYVKPAIAVLDQPAKDAGIIILNECGLDPGLDHMGAMRIIDHVHSKGGKVKEFYSLCGALPAPEANDNLFGYKFSWSPKGVVLASGNDAVYKKHGKIVEVEAINLFKDRFSIFDFEKETGRLEVYPNRNSLDYLEIYKIPEAETMFRGTIRFPYWCEILDAVKACDLISQDSKDFTGKSYAEMTAMMIHCPVAEVKAAAAKKSGYDINSEAIKGMEWLGLFSDEKMNRTLDSPFEVIAFLMIDKMPLKEKERDMNVMLHVLLAEYPDGSREVIKSKMLDFGSSETDTAIARNVTLPASVAVQLVVEGKLPMKGVYRPTMPEIYNPILDRLAEYGITTYETFGLPESEMIK
ncbi:MAG: saccharopine dehydrogenase NADP-binding domain-containing protein [Bacteroidales bacterium]|jgi:saccharopine dehydrogenase-like NADP-dependent oxidoreductase|nr:saccharopine dehydrogenase NADP-binding domain-containing protein [Bacteroidales bacterium]